MPSINSIDHRYNRVLISKGWQIKQAVSLIVRRPRKGLVKSLLILYKRIIHVSNTWCGRKEQPFTIDRCRYKKSKSYALRNEFEIILPNAGQKSNNPKNLMKY